MARLIAGALAPLALLPLLASCGQLSAASLEITMLVGSALGGFCKEAAATIERDPPRLPDGTRVLLRCRASGSGDVVSEMEGHARAVLQGGGRADDPAIPTLVSVDGEIYQELLRHRLQAIAPGRSLIPPSADAPALATSPMVLMTTPALVKGLQRPQPFLALARADTHQQLDPTGPPQPIRFVQTAPTRSNSGLQTLVAMVAEVSGKRPEQLTLADVKAHAAAVAAIQKHVTRYGSSTDELARTMQRNGVFWASVASVYESSVVAANGRREPGQEALVAVYPRATYTSTMRAILPTAPWVSAQERQAAALLIERLQQPAIQRIAADQGLRPANPAVPMRRITAAYGADPRAVYDSLRAPSPEVVEAIITTWRNQVKKPSRVALVVDSSGSMQGDKLPSAQRSLQAYLAQTGPRDVLGLIDFDSTVREPVELSGGPADAAKVMTFVSGLKADGGTRLYDAVEAGRNWLRRTRKPGEILAVVVLTDGNDAGSRLSLETLEAELRRSGFASDDRIGVFTIGYGSSGNYDAAALRRIAESNGGVFVEGTPDSILKRMEQLQQSF
ncbi:VWA domain-containing protein [Vulcanococcus limneticus Candia 3F8]|uniref:VWA domain-containing protein n=1 Tax=Vulcanococcus limneticus TaxID=2170428 RepID=UPI000B9901C4|nr:VWA domain-containing protein [Vulcanococcus limneticus]MCP9792184.1 VWA domain-containing protein [Vulcanococcus limneticus MW73D5]MCP9895424.1 VWA domain-containing protein [Vulcanococcus limneticus Candia 3F8]MCP9897625.1 VWA domain-containing protein [Vulcanococcus limneticus Candia 3B3]